MTQPLSSGRWDASGSWEDAVSVEREKAFNWAKSLPLKTLHWAVTTMASDVNAFSLYERKAILEIMALHLGRVTEKRTMLQEEIAAWHTKRFPDAQSYHVAIKAMEELGEVASEINGDLKKNSDNRGGKTPEEAADVVICLMVLIGRWYPDRDLLVEVQKKLDILTDPNSGHRSAALPVAYDPDTMASGTSKAYEYSWQKSKPKENRCHCGDYCFGSYTQCGGPSGCFNCPA